MPDLRRPDTRSCNLYTRLRTCALRGFCRTMVFCQISVCYTVTVQRVQQGFSTRFGQAYQWGQADHPALAQEVDDMNLVRSIALIASIVIAVIVLMVFIQLFLKIALGIALLALAYYWFVRATSESRNKRRFKRWR